MTEIIINGKTFNNYEKALNAFYNLRGFKKIYNIDLMVKRPNNKKYELMHFSENSEIELFEAVFYNVLYNSDYAFYLPTAIEAEKLTLLTFSEWKNLDIEDYYKISLDLNFSPLVKYVIFNSELLSLETAKERLKKCVKFFDEIEKAQS